MHDDVNAALQVQYKKCSSEAKAKKSQEENSFLAAVMLQNTFPVFQHILSQFILVFFFFMIYFS